MNHESIKEKLYDYQDGELSDQEQLEIETHLSTCLECRHRLATWGKIAETIFSAPPSSNTDHFVTRVMAQIDSRSRPVNRSWWPVGALGVAVILILTMGGITDEMRLSTRDLLLTPSSDEKWDVFDDSTEALEQDELLEEITEAL
ncbi:MAG: hypothetical protein KCHDKBKB_01359 [Elusimicrobia bacterium]|nr:hypothetical protein [Elusimicrobiota bacterium]